MQGLFSGPCFLGAEMGRNRYTVEILLHFSANDVKYIVEIL